MEVYNAVIWAAAARLLAPSVGHGCRLLHTDAPIAPRRATCPQAQVAEFGIDVKNMFEFWDVSCWLCVSCSFSLNPHP